MNPSCRNSSLLLALGTVVGIHFSTIVGLSNIQSHLFQYSDLYPESKDGLLETRSTDFEVSDERDSHPAHFQTKAKVVKARDNVDTPIHYRAIVIPTLILSIQK